jgi:hypothetical protein
VRRQQSPGDRAGRPGTAWRPVLARGGPGLRHLVGATPMAGRSAGFHPGG